MNEKHTCICTYMHMHVYIYIYVCVCMCVYIYTKLDMYIQSYINKYIYIYILLSHSTCTTQTVSGCFSTQLWNKSSSNMPPMRSRRQRTQRNPHAMHHHTTIKVHWARPMNGSWYGEELIATALQWKFEIWAASWQLSSTAAQVCDIEQQNGARSIAHELVLHQNPDTYWSDQTKVPNVAPHAV